MKFWDLVLLYFSFKWELRCQIDGCFGGGIGAMNLVILELKQPYHFFVFDVIYSL